MIHFERPAEPGNFQETVEVPGKDWLRDHPNANPKEFPKYWKTCQPELARGFRCLCAYSLMHISCSGVVDHYLSKSRDRGLAYEWSNYRYACSTMNSRKWTFDERILDPFEVQDGWFEVQLGSWQLLITDRIPESKRERAGFTLEQLQLGTGDDVTSARRFAYDRFANGEFTLIALNVHAPLVFTAVMHALDRLVPVPDEEERYSEFLAGEISITSLERDAPRIAANVRAELPPCSGNDFI
jgi:hypothetical protein